MFLRSLNITKTPITLGITAFKTIFFLDQKVSEVKLIF